MILDNIIFSVPLYDQDCVKPILQIQTFIYRSDMFKTHAESVDSRAKRISYMKSTDYQIGLKKTAFWFIKFITITSLC